MTINNIKRLLNIPLQDHSKDELIGTISDLCLAKVKTFCNIPNEHELLDDFDFNLLIAQITADIYKTYVSEEDMARERKERSEEVKAVTMADYKVEYNVASMSKNYKTSSLSDAIKFNLDKYDEELVNYKFVKFY